MTLLVFELVLEEVAEMRIADHGQEGQESSAIADIEDDLFVAVLINIETGEEHGVSGSGVGV